jgi:hypothetical protein
MQGAVMNRWLFIVFMITLSIYTAFGMGSESHEPSSPQAQEGKAVYVPINPVVSILDEQKIQKDDQNITGHGKAK